LSIILEFFSFNSYVLDFGLEGGVLGLGLGLGSCGLGLGLEVCVLGLAFLGLALALGVMSLLTSLVQTVCKRNIPALLQIKKMNTRYLHHHIQQFCRPLT